MCLVISTCTDVLEQRRKNTGIVSQIPGILNCTFLLCIVQVSVLGRWDSGFSISIHANCIFSQDLSSTKI